MNKKTFSLLFQEIWPKILKIKVNKDRHGVKFSRNIWKPLKYFYLPAPTNPAIVVIQIMQSILNAIHAINSYFTIILFLFPLDLAFN